MKDYNFQHLPKSFGIDTKKEENHPRLNELKSIFKDKFKEEPDYQFIGIDNYGRWNNWGKECLSCSSVQIISLDTFFALIDPLRLEKGNWLFCVSEETNFTISEIYGVNTFDDYGETAPYTFNDFGDKYTLYEKTDSKYFRNATPEEIEQLEKDTISNTEAWTPKPEEEVLVSNDSKTWHRRTYVGTYKGNHLLENEIGEIERIDWAFMKTYKPDTFSEEDKKLIRSLEDKYGVKITATKIK